MEIKETNLSENPSDNQMPENEPWEGGEAEKAWEAAKDQIYNLWREVYGLARQKREAAAYHEKMGSFGDILRYVFKDPSEYISFHILGGSSGVDFKKAPKIDFFPPYSVADFLQKLKRELEGK